ncbi:hypothetical protein [Bradyrhizobium sp. 195]|uniref:hypothetical protein n=1 Tax=Bradyrhizobium sp. 195 TaxID=2782662 RepID=UPI002001B48A|nr:hypothetical protein [Bradyrhizobium sp. 195]UPK28299.1 hypothetical protein IVB26_07590 [Bradyrhizobium sp. 195]
MQQLETTIVSLAKRGEQLVAKRVTAQAALDQAIQARRDTLLSADLEDHRELDKQQAAVVAATSDLAGIDDALAVLAHQKAEGERQLAAESERIKRATAADKLAKQVTAIEAALPGYLEQSRALTDALSESGLPPEHHGPDRSCRQLHPRGAEGDARRDPAGSAGDPAALVPAKVGVAEPPLTMTGF